MAWELASEYPYLAEEPFGGVSLGGGPPVVWFPEGASVRIARMRRGKYVRIPQEWMGKVPQGSQPERFKGRAKKVRRRARGTFPYTERFKGERKAPGIEEVA